LRRTASPNTLAELTLENAVDAADLLLFAQLLPYPDRRWPDFWPCWPGAYARRSIGTLVSEALFALEEELFALTAALAALGV
jgi:hypothetical protein